MLTSALLAKKRNRLCVIVELLTGTHRVLHDLTYYFLDYSSDATTGALLIPLVKQSDDGDYVCVLGNTCKQASLWVAGM